MLHALQDAIRLTPLDDGGKPDARFPLLDLSAYEIPAMRLTRDPLQYFEYMNFYTGINPPPPEMRAWRIFKTAGVGPGSQLPTDENAQPSDRQGAADAQAIMNAHISAGAVRNGWRVPDQVSGMAGPHLLGARRTGDADGLVPAAGSHLLLRLSR